MDQGNTATPDELQQAINSITNGGAQNDAVAQVENSVLGAAPPPLQLRLLLQRRHRHLWK